MNEDTLRTLALMNETGYQIQQDNGQRIYGPPPDWKGPAPKDTEVFIGKLPNDIFEYDIVPLFSSVGKIYLLRIMQNFSGLNRGFAFIQYTTKEEADLCISRLNNTEIRPGEKIGVVKSKNNCRLYIYRLDQSLTKDEIKEELEKYTEDIVDVIVHKNDQPDLNNRGYAFVEYQTHKAAAKARRKLVPCKVKIRGIEITVDWATPIHESGENINVTCSLLIKNIKESLSNLELCKFFSVRNSLRISKIKRLKNQVLIIFATRQLCETAMRIYTDLKNTIEFQLLAEKNKRIEIVYLKNTMDLSSFLSAVNYTPQIFFPNNNSTMSSNLSLNSTMYQNQSFNSSIYNQSVNSTIYHNQSLNSPDHNQSIYSQQQQHCSNLDDKFSKLNCHDECRCLCVANRKMISNNEDTNNNSIMKPNMQTLQSFNNRQNRAIQLSQHQQHHHQHHHQQHQHYHQQQQLINNNQCNNMIKTNNMIHCNNNQKIINEKINKLPINMRKPLNPIMNSIPNHNINNRLYRPSPINLMPNQLLFNQLSRQVTPTIVSPSENMFIKNSLEKNMINNKSYQMNNHLNYLNNQNLNNNLNESTYLTKIPEQQILLSSSNVPLNNSSYNFPIWSNRYNLDASANWSKFKDIKLDNGRLIKKNSICSPTEISNISEEDTCSGSDLDLNANIDNFNCFNPVNSFNLRAWINTDNKNLMNNQLYNKNLNTEMRNN